jgi:malonyl CoA-acyl carrier protein transacylase
VRSAAAVRDALIRQIDSPVRWVECMEWMAREGGVAAVLEVGAGSVLSGLNRRILTGVQAASLAEPEQLQKLLAGWAARAADAPAAPEAPVAPVAPAERGSR